MIQLLNVLLILFGLPAIVAPIAVVAFRELAPARTARFQPAFAGIGGFR